MPLTEINGINIYYEIHGEGEPIIFGNGVFQNTTGWINQLKPFSSEYQVILYDMRGQGQSDKPENPYSFDIHAEDQKALLEDLGISKVHHIGISYGAELGLVFALKYPDMLKSLVVCSAVSFVGPLLYKMVELWRLACAREDPELFYHSTLPLNFGETFLRENTAILEQARERYTTLDYPPFVRLIDAFLKLDITDQLNQIKIPTCVIAGEKDILKPAYPYSKVIHDKIPNSEMMVVPDAGHAMMFDKPDEFNSIVLGFLRKHSK